jgi:PhnB protein
MDDAFPASISPALTVRNAAAGVEFYKRAFGAVETMRHVTPTGVVVAEMAIDGARFLVVDEARRTST